MRYIIGVDAGAVRTTAAAFDLSGRLLSIENGKSGNVSENFDSGVRNILDTIAIINDSLENQCVLVVIGVAGMETSGLKERLTEALQAKLTCPVQVFSDAQLAMYAYFQGGDGVLAIAGTGSIAYAKRGDTYYRCGGYGTILGDEGSAYYIAIEGLKLCLRRSDMGLPPDSLTNAMVDAVGGDLKSVVDFVATHTKQEIASLAPIVSAFAARNDRDARQILVNAGSLLADNVNVLLRRLSLLSPAIAVSGSILQNVNTVTDSFYRRVLEQFPNARFITDEVVIPKGAYYRYLATVKPTEE
ncbi:MAG: hypothetical protein IKV30_01675 [Clostridia bacterium]|nr:hypothetical protein [Clostridia bacterium]